MVVLTDYHTKKPSGGNHMSQSLSPTDNVSKDVINRIGEVSRLLVEGENLRQRENALQEEIINAKVERRKSLVDAIGCGIIFGGIALALLIIVPSGLTAIIFGFVCILCIKLFFDFKKEAKAIEKKERELNLIPTQYDRTMGSINKSDLAMLPPDYRTAEAAEYIYKALVNGRALTMQQAVNLYELKNGR